MKEPGRPLPCVCWEFLSLDHIHGKEIAVWDTPHPATPRCHKLAFATSRWQDQNPDKQKDFQTGKMTKGIGLFWALLKLLFDPFCCPFVHLVSLALNVGDTRQDWELKKQQPKTMALQGVICPIRQGEVFISNSNSDGFNCGVINC